MVPTLQVSMSFSLYMWYHMVMLGMHVFFGHTRVIIFLDLHMGPENGVDPESNRLFTLW